MVFTGALVVLTGALVVLRVVRVVLLVLGALVVVTGALVVPKVGLLVLGVVLSLLNSGLVVVVGAVEVKSEKEAKRAFGLTLLSLEFWKVKGVRWGWELSWLEDTNRLEDDN